MRCFNCIPYIGKLEFTSLNMKLLGNTIILAIGTLSDSRVVLKLYG